MYVTYRKTILSLWSIQVYNIISPNNNGGNIQETVTIDNEKNTAIVNIHAGSCSSTTVFDYKHVSCKGIFILFEYYNLSCKSRRMSLLLLFLLNN